MSRPYSFSLGYQERLNRQVLLLHFQIVQVAICLARTTLMVQVMGHQGL